MCVEEHKYNHVTKEVIYAQTSAQREHYNVSVFVRGMCITQREIVSNYCLKWCSNKYFLQNISFFDAIFTHQNNRNISSKNSKTIL